MTDRVLSLVRDSGVEMNATQIPALLGTNGLGQLQGVVVRELIAKGFFGGIEEVLAIEIGQGILCFWFKNHSAPPKK